MSSGKDNKKRLRLTERDERLMRHLAEFRMSTLPVIEAVCFEGKSTVAAKSGLRRLMRAKPAVIRSRPLYGRHVYYQLTYAGSRRLGVSHRAAQSIGAMAVARQYALQTFHFLEHENVRRRLTGEQVHKATEVRGPRWQANLFYLVRGDDKRLGYIVVDFGSTPARFADRILKRMTSLLEYDRIRRFVKAKAFELSVLTLTPGKRDSIGQRLKLDANGSMRVRMQQDVFTIHVRLRVIPGLLELIPNPQQ